MGITNFYNKERKVYSQNPYMDKYCKDMEQVEVMWAVLRNLYSDEQAAHFERFCRMNIAEYRDMYAFDMEHEQEPPHHAPCCVRLAMLYERQGKLKEAIDTCAFAIRIGAYEDGSKGQMYGRLARLIKKSGLNIDMQKLLEGENG